MEGEGSRLRYAVRLRRLPGAAAFGIVVTERAGKPRPDEPVDATDLSSRIYVKEILAPLKDAMLGPPELVAPRDDARAARYALAHPAPGDVLACVDDDDVTPWPAARVSMRGQPSLPGSALPCLSTACSTSGPNDSPTTAHEEGSCVRSA